MKGGYRVWKKEHESSALKKTVMYICARLGDEGFSDFTRVIIQHGSKKELNGEPYN